MLLRFDQKTKPFFGPRPALAQKGFTAIELMTAVAILGVLVGMGMPSMAQFIAEWRVNSAANTLTRDIRITKNEAIKRSRPAVLCRRKKVAANQPEQCDDAGMDWQQGWLVFVDQKVDDKFVEADGDELIAVQTELPGLGALAYNKAVKGFTFGPHGLMKGSANGTFKITSSLGGAQPKEKKCLTIATTGRLKEREKKPGTKEYVEDC